MMSTRSSMHWESGDLSLGVKRPELESNHLTPSNAKVKKAWNYNSTLHTSSWRGA
jgi:hypothetical protein